MNRRQKTLTATEKLREAEEILEIENPSKIQLIKAKEILKELLIHTKTNRSNPKNKNPTKKLLGLQDFEIIRTNYIQGISPVIKSAINQPSTLKSKLDYIFSGLSEYLYNSKLQDPETNSKEENPEELAREHASKHWHALANSIATHARIIHSKTPSAPSLLYISLDKSQRSAKVVVLESPSAAEIHSELYPDTKSINNWIKKLNLS